MLSKFTPGTITSLLILVAFSFELSLCASAITLVNNIDTDNLVTLYFFDANNKRITTASLYYQETITIKTLRTIKKITWQEEYDLWTPSLRYTLNVTIPWYFLYAGIFLVFRQGEYKTSFFGKGIAHAELIDYWKQMLYQNAIGSLDLSTDCISQHVMPQLLKRQAR